MMFACLVELMLQPVIAEDFGCQNSLVVDQRLVSDADVIEIAFAHAPRNLDAYSSDVRLFLVVMVVDLVT